MMCGVLRLAILRKIAGPGPPENSVSQFEIFPYPGIGHKNSTLGRRHQGCLASTCGSAPKTIRGGEPRTLWVLQENEEVYYAVV